MKKIRILALVCAAAFLAGAWALPARGAESLKYYSVNVDNSLNGRAKPSTSADISTRLRNGDCVVSNGKATKADGYSWVQIMHPRDVSTLVWVADKYVKPSPFCEQAFEEAQSLYVSFADAWGGFFGNFCATRDYTLSFDIPADAAQRLKSGAASTMATQYKFYCYDTGKEREDPAEKTPGAEGMAAVLDTMKAAAEQTLYEELCQLPAEDAFFQVFTPEANAADGTLSLSYFGGADCGQMLIMKKNGGAWQSVKLEFHCAVCW